MMLSAVAIVTASVELPITVCCRTTHIIAGEDNVAASVPSRTAEAALRMVRLVLLRLVSLGLWLVTLSLWLKSLDLWLICMGLGLVSLGLWLVGLRVLVLVGLKGLWVFGCLRDEALQGRGVLGAAYACAAQFERRHRGGTGRSGGGREGAGVRGDGAPTGAW